jgi:hypothetical protein
MMFTDEVDDAVTRIMADYNDRIPAGRILRCFARSMHELRASGVQAGLVIAAEAMTRQRLGLSLHESASAA